MANLPVEIKRGNRLEEKVPSNGRGKIFLNGIPLGRAEISPSLDKIRGAKNFMETPMKG